MNDNNKKYNSNIIQIPNQKSKGSSGTSSNNPNPKEDHKLIQQGFLSQADLNLQNILSSFFSNVEEEGLSDSMIEGKLAMIQTNKKAISKRHYNSSSSSSDDNTYSKKSSKINIRNISNININNSSNNNNSNSNNRFLKVSSPKSGSAFSLRQKTNGSSKFEKLLTKKSAMSKIDQEYINPIQLLGDLKNAAVAVDPSLSTRRRNSIVNKKHLIQRKSFQQESIKNLPLIYFQPSEEEKDVFKMVPLINISKEKNTMRSLCSEIHENINIKPVNSLDEVIIHIPSDRSHKEYNEEKEDEEKLMQNDTMNPFKCLNTFEIEKKEYPFRRLQRRNNAVYDSLSEDEENELDYSSINPNSTFKIVYDGILLLLTIISFIYVPFFIAFIHKDTNTLSFVFILNVFIDLYFVLDIFLSFFTEYFDMEEQLIQDPHNIVNHYLSGWFLMDIISGFPVATCIDSYMLIYPNSLFTTSTFLVYSNTDILFIHLLKFLRLLKGIKIFFDNSFIKFIVDNYFHNLTYSRWTRLYITLIAFLIFVQVLSSCFAFLGFAYYPSWIEVNHLDINSLFHIYITSIYFICITVFGIGYGDIVPINIQERIFSLFLLIVGVMIYSWTVSSISSYSEEKNEKVNEYKEKMAVLEHIKLANNQVSSCLNKKIQRFLSYNLEHEQFNSEEILEQLPVKLKNEVIYEMYKPILNNFIFFKSFKNNDFSIKVLLSFKPIVMIKNELVVSEGDYLEEMFFVKRGLLALELPIPSVITEDFDKTTIINTIISNNILGRTTTKFKGTNASKITLNKNFTKVKFQQETKKEEKLLNYERQYVKLIEIRNNEHFGDIMMFLNQRCPLRVRIKSSKAELYLLKKTDAIDISMSFPKIWRKIIKKSLFNYEQLNRLVKKTLRFFFLSNQKSLYHLEKKFNLVSKPNYNDTNITDLAFQDVNPNVIDLNSHNNSSESLATIPSCIDKNSSSNRSIAQLPILTPEDDNEGELKNTESSTSQLIPDKKGLGLIKMSSKSINLPQNFRKNSNNDVILPKKKASKPILSLNDLMPSSSKPEEPLPVINFNKITEYTKDECNDSKSRISFDIVNISKRGINSNQNQNQNANSNSVRNNKLQLIDNHYINPELLPGEVIYRLEDYETKSLSNLNIDKSLISIRKNCNKNFINCNYYQNAFASKLSLQKTNAFQFIIQPSINHAKSKKSRKSTSIRNSKSITVENSPHMPPIQIISTITSPTSRRASQFPLATESKASIMPPPILELGKNILAIPGITGAKREDGNTSSRSQNNDSNNSFRSIFESNKKMKTPDLRPRKLINNSGRGSINLLNQIGENIHKNSINLNNPSLFYSNAFSDMINKVNNDQHNNNTATNNANDKQTDEKVINEKHINKKLEDVLKIIEDNSDL